MNTKNNTAPVDPGTSSSGGGKSATGEVPVWQPVLMGGIPGILIGAAGMMGIQEAMAQSAGEPEDVPAGGDEEVHVAHSVTNDMSFNEAFASARAEVGAGGAFVWHGNVYGTYRADDAEWMEMTAEERVEHSQWILSQVHGTPYTPEVNGNEVVVVNTDVEPEDPVVNDIDPVNLVEDDIGCVYGPPPMDDDISDINEVGNTQDDIVDDDIACVYGPPPMDFDDIMP